MDTPLVANVLFTGSAMWSAHTIKGLERRAEAAQHRAKMESAPNRLVIGPLPVAAYWKAKPRLARMARRPFLICSRTPLVSQCGHVWQQLVAAHVPPWSCIRSGMPRSPWRSPGGQRRRLQPQHRSATALCCTPWQPAQAQTWVAVALALQPLSDAEEGAVALAARVHKVHPPLKLHEAAQRELDDQQRRCSQPRRASVPAERRAARQAGQGRTVGDLGVVVGPDLAGVVPLGHIEDAGLREQLQGSARVSTACSKPSELVHDHQSGSPLG